MNKIMLEDFECDIQKICPSCHLFDILSLTENNVSNIIAWLMSDKNLSQGFMQCFKKQIATDNKITFYYKDNKIIKTTEKNNDDIFNNIYVTTEYSAEYRKVSGRMDLLVIDVENNLALVIENKYGSHLHDNQLARYEKFCLNKTQIPCAFVYLDVNYDEDNQSVDEHWIAINYDCISKFIKEKSGKVDDRYKYLLDALEEQISEKQKTDDIQYYSNLCDLSQKYNSILSKIDKLKEGGIFDKRNAKDNKYYFLYQKYPYVIDDLLTCKKYSKIYKIYNELKSRDICVSNSLIAKGVVDITLDKIKDMSGKYWFLYTRIQQKDDKIGINSYIVPQNVKDKELSQEIAKQYNCRTYKTLKSTRDDVSGKVIDEHINILKKQLRNIEEYIK